MMKKQEEFLLLFCAMRTPPISRELHACGISHNVNPSFKVSGKHVPLL